MEVIQDASIVDRISLQNLIINQTTDTISYYDVSIGVMVTEEIISFLV